MSLIAIANYCAGCLAGHQIHHMTDLEHTGDEEEGTSDELCDSEFLSRRVSD
jgi:hypothetical protein